MILDKVDQGANIHLADLDHLGKDESLLKGVTLR